MNSLDTTDKKALAIFCVALLAMLGLAMWGGSCMGASRARSQYEEESLQSVPKATPQAVNTELAEMRTASASLQKENEEFRGRLESAKTDLSGSQSETANLQKDNEQLKTRLESVQSELSTLQSSSETLQQDNDKLRPQLESLQAELAQTRSRITTLQQETAGMQAQLGSARTELSQLQSRYNSLQDTANSLRTQLASTQSQLSQGQSALTALQQDNTGLRAQLAQWYAWLRNSPPPPPTVTPAAGGPGIMLSPASGPAGAVITVTGNGLPANTLGNVFLDINGNSAFDQGEPVQYVTTSAAGAFSTSLNLPASPPVLPGSRQVLASFPMGSPPQTSTIFTVTFQ